MEIRRILLVGVFIVVAVVAEVTILAPIPFPGATPSLVLVVVAAFAFSLGPVTGAVTGFSAGLLLDLAPPAAGTIGVSSLILTVVGYALGRAMESDDRPVILTTLLTGAAGGLAILAAALLGGLLGNPRIEWGSLLWMVVTGALYAALLALVIIPFVRWACRKVIPDSFPR